MRTERIVVKQNEVAEVAIKRDEKVLDLQSGTHSVVVIHGPAVINVVVSPKSK